LEDYKGMHRMKYKIPLYLSAPEFFAVKKAIDEEVSAIQCLDGDGDSLEDDTNRDYRLLVNVQTRMKQTEQNVIIPH
jgi:hypothetical protein